MARAWLRSTGQNPFANQKTAMLAVMGGAAGGQLLVAASAPFLSRLYSPAEFGTFSVALTAVITIGTVSSLRLDAAVPVAEDRESALAAVNLAAITIATTAMVGILICGLWATPIVELLNVPSLGPYLWMVPVIAAVLGSYQLLNQLAIRERRYGATATRAMLSAAAAVTLQIVAGLLGIGFMGLLLGYGAGQLVGALTLAAGSGALFTAAARVSRSPAMLKSTLRRFKRFPAYLAPAALLNVLSLQLPVVLMAALYGVAESGWLGMTQRVLGLPIALIGVAVGQVYLGEMSSSMRSDGTRAVAMFQHATRMLGLIGLALAAALLLAGPWAFSLVFGDEWNESGRYAQAMALALAAQLIASPLASTLTVLEKPVFSLLLDVARLLGTAGAMLLVFMLGGTALEAVWALGLGGLVTYTMYWSLSRRLLKSTIRVRSASDEGD